MLVRKTMNRRDQLLRHTARNLSLIDCTFTGSIIRWLDEGFTIGIDHHGTYLLIVIAEEVHCATFFRQDIDFFAGQRSPTGEVMLLESNLLVVMTEAVFAVIQSVITFLLVSHETVEVSY